MSSQTIEQIIMPSPQTSIRPSDYQANPFAVTTTALTPSRRSYTRKITLPKQDYAKYEGAEYEDVKVDPIKTQFGLREVFVTTPESRRDYVKTRKDYNIQATDYNKQALESIETQKREIAKYNEAVDDWNKKGRFQEQTFTEEYFPSSTIYEYPTIKYQQRSASKLSPEEIRAKLFKPVSSDTKDKTPLILRPTVTSTLVLPTSTSGIIMPQDVRISVEPKKQLASVITTPTLQAMPSMTFKQKMEDSLKIFTNVFVTKTLSRTNEGRSRLKDAGMPIERGLLKQSFLVSQPTKSGFDVFAGGSPIASALLQASVPRISDTSQWLRDVSIKAEQDFVSGKKLRGEYKTPEGKFLGQQLKKFTFQTTRFASIPVGLLDITAQTIDKPGRTIPIIASALPSVPKSLVAEAKAYPRGFATEFVAGFFFDSLIGSPVGSQVRKGVKSTVDFAIQPEQIAKRTPFETEGFKFTTQSGRQIDVSLTPPGKKPRLGVDLEEFIRTYRDDIQRKATPEMPTNLSSTQKRLLSVVRETDSVIGGGLARNIVFESTAVRKFLPTSDLDIGVSNLKLFKKAVRTEFGKDVTFNKLAMSTQVSIKGKPFADLVDLSVFEGRKLTLEKFPDVMLGKLRVASPEALIVGKAKSLTVGVQPKSIKDIISGLGETPQITEALSGAKTRGGFGWSFAEQGRYIGQSVDIISGQGSPGLSKFFSNGFKEALNPTQLRRIRKHFFASPDAELRISRVGSDTSSKSFTSIWDVLRGKAEFGGLTAGSEIFFMEKAPVSNLTPRLRKLYEKAKLYEKGDTKFIKEYQDFWKEYSVFQETRTGTFKPFGQPSGEIELTLAPTEVMELLGGTPRLARTTKVRIGDQLVPLYEFKVAPKSFTPPKSTLKKSSIAEFLDDSLNLLKSEKGFVNILKRDKYDPKNFPFTGTAKQRMDFQVGKYTQELAKIDFSDLALRNKPVRVRVIKGDADRVMPKFDFSSGDVIKLYHGTSAKNFDKILTEGFKTRTSNWAKDKTFVEPLYSFTLQKRVARGYAGKTGKIIELDIPKNIYPKLDEDLFFTDPFTGGSGQLNRAVDPKIYKALQLDRFVVGSEAYKKAVSRARTTIPKSNLTSFIDKTFNLLKSEKGFVDPLGQKRVVSPRRLTAPSPDKQANKQLERNFRRQQRTSSSDTIRIRPTYTPESLTSDVLSGAVISPRKAIPSGMISPRRLTATGSTGARPRSPEPSKSLLTKGIKSPFTGTRTSDSTTITTSRTAPSGTITYKSTDAITSLTSGGTSTTTSTSLLAPPTYSPSGMPSPPSPALTTLTPTPPFSPPFRKRPSTSSKREREVNLEDTWIPEYKSKGRWMPIKVDNKKRNYYSAKELGSYVVDNSAERSFRLRKGQGRADIIQKTKPSNMFKYYKPSKTGNPRLTGAWIEESKFAIDTAGERQGITAKGLIAMERKRQAERLNPFQARMNKTNQNKLRGKSLVNKLLRK